MAARQLLRTATLAGIIMLTPRLAAGNGLERTAPAQPAPAPRPVAEISNYAIIPKRHPILTEPEKYLGSLPDSLDDYKQPLPDSYVPTHVR